MSTIINLTPHAVTLCQLDGTPIYTWQPTVPAARAEVVTEPAQPNNLIQPVLVPDPTGSPADLVQIAEVVVPLETRRFGEPTFLPDPEAGVYLIVSLVVVQAALAFGRSVSDLLSPGNLVRDGRGQVIGCTSFALAH